MKKFLKFIGGALISIVSIVLFFAALTYKAFWIPFLSGLLGLLLPVLVAMDMRSFKKDWKPVTITVITSIILICCAGQLFCDNYDGPDWLFNTFHSGFIIFLVLDAVTVCTVIILSILKKAKKS